MTTKPAVSIVWLHGAWHQPSHYSSIIEKLQAQGYEVEAPATASAADTAISDVFAADVAMAKKAIKSFVDDGKNVVVAMHSYGGVYGSEAVAELLEDLKGEESKGRVVHLFYIAAIILEKGTSVLDDGFTPHALDFENGLMHHLEPYNKFYATTPPDVARKAINTLKPQATESFATKTKHRGWADQEISVTYLACDQDRALPLDTDVARFIKRLETAGLKDFNLRRIDCNHSPFISAEKEFMDVMNEVLKKAATFAGSQT